MSSTSFKVMHCDRCGNEETSDCAQAPPEWGRIVARRVNGNGGIGVHETPDDLCPSCLSALLAWYREPRVAAAPPPAPPPPTPAAPKPRPVTAAERDALVDEAAQLLKAQVNQSIGAARAQPAAALASDELIPELLAGIDVRARAIADAAIARLADRPTPAKARPRKAKS
ncbi:MAG TPA: hypothetical protein VF628_11265 [Allosphingosinicella sp.]|jgi:hypothetical protein